MRYKLIILAMGLFLFKINTWLIRQQVDIRQEQEQAFIQDEFNSKNYGWSYFPAVKEATRSSQSNYPDCMNVKELEKKSGQPVEEMISYYNAVRNCNPAFDLEKLPSTQWIPDLLDTLLLNDFADYEIRKLIKLNGWKARHVSGEIHLIVHSVKPKGNSLFIDVNPIGLVHDAPLQAKINDTYVPATNPMILKKNQVLTSWMITNPYTNESQVFKHQ